MSTPDPAILVLEAFYGGSHKQLVDTLAAGIPGCSVHTLPAKKWHWRARTAALWFAENVPPCSTYKTLFTSSVLNLAELVALRPDLAGLRKVLYFHENQLVYPVRKQQERDFQYGYNQILSCLVADVVLFNSRFNMDSFLSSIPSFLKLMPDHRPKHLQDKIQPKCHVLHFPVSFPEMNNIKQTMANTSQCASTDTGQIQGASEFTSHSSSSLVANRCHPDLSHPDNIDTNSCSSTSKCKPADDIGSITVPDINTSSFPLENIKDEEGQGNKEVTNVPNNICAIPGNSTIKRSAGIVPVNKHCALSPGKHNSLVSSDSCRLVPKCERQSAELHIVWPHRWEHDKGPEEFFSVLRQLKAGGATFKLSVLGETFTDVPDVFSQAKEEFKQEIIHWGYLPSREDYYQVLRTSHVVVSTALHEFFGVAMLEAAYCGCYPLAPNRLVYPEIFPGECLYNTPKQLVKKLREFCKHPHVVHKKLPKLDLHKYSWDRLSDDYIRYLSPPMGTS